MTLGLVVGNVIADESVARLFRLVSVYIAISLAPQFAVVWLNVTSEARFTVSVTVDTDAVLG